MKSPGTRLGSFVAVLIVGGGLGSVALAGLVPGKGAARSNCYVEYDVQGITNPSANVQKEGRIALCTDGEPCDTDGTCGDDKCTLRIAVCINQTDPNLPSCAAPGGLDRVKITGKGKTLLSFGRAGIARLPPGEAGGAVMASDAMGLIVAGVTPAGLAQQGFVSRVLLTPLFAP